MTTNNLCEGYNKIIKLHDGTKNKARRIRLYELLDTLLSKIFPAEDAKYRRKHQDVLRST